MQQQERPIPGAAGDMWELDYFTGQRIERQPDAGARLPPALTGSQIFAEGTAGCLVTQRAVRETLERDGERLSAAYLDYPVPQIAPLKATLADGEILDIPATPFCPVGEAGERRDRANQHPLLRARYSSSNLLRGTPVYEDRKLALSGEGGGALPPVTALDIDLNIARIQTFLAEQMRWMHGIETGNAGQSDFMNLLEARERRDQRDNRQWRVISVFGGAGATGNSLSQLAPYLIRRQLHDMGIAACQLWGVALGPFAFKGLTPYVLTNFRALMRSLDFMARYGQTREYINGLTIDMKLPPYDHVFVIDDPTLETGVDGRVTEAALDDFYNRAARTLRLLLMSNAWETVRARVVNSHEDYDDGDAPRFITVLNLASAHVNRPVLSGWGAARRQGRLLRELSSRLAA